MERAREKLIEETGWSLKQETFRSWCQEIGMVKRAKKRRSRARYKRERMPEPGLLLQMDGRPLWRHQAPGLLTSEAGQDRQLPSIRRKVWQVAVAMEGSQRAPMSVRKTQKIKKFRRPCSILSRTYCFESELFRQAQDSQGTSRRKTITL
jgi:hypothetical protein